MTVRSMLCSECTHPQALIGFLKAWYRVRERGAGLGLGRHGFHVETRITLLAYRGWNPRAGWKLEGSPGNG